VSVARSTIFARSSNASVPASVSGRKSASAILSVAASFQIISARSVHARSAISLTTSFDAKNNAYTHIAPIRVRSTTSVDVNASRFMMVLRVVLVV